MKDEWKKSSLVAIAKSLTIKSELF
jgi:hypothetical protein